MPVQYSILDSTFDLIQRSIIAKFKNERWKTLGNQRWKRELPDQMSDADDAVAKQGQT